MKHSPRLAQHSCATGLTLFPPVVSCNVIPCAVIRRLRRTPEEWLVRDDACDWLLHRPMKTESDDVYRFGEVRIEVMQLIILALPRSALIAC